MNVIDIIVAAVIAVIFSLSSDVVKKRKAGITSCGCGKRSQRAAAQAGCHPHN